MNTSILKLIQSDQWTGFFAMFPPILVLMYVDFTYFGFINKYLNRGGFHNGEHDFVWMAISFAISLICLVGLYIRVRKVRNVIEIGDQVQARITSKHTRWAKGQNVLFVEYEYGDFVYTNELRVLKNKTSDNFREKQLVTLIIDPKNPLKPLIKEMFS